jgi:hypothetical protein
MIRSKPITTLSYTVNGRSCRGFRRVECPTFEVADTNALSSPSEEVLVLEDEHLEFVQTAQEHHDET